MQCWKQAAATTTKLLLRIFFYGCIKLVRAVEALWSSAARPHNAPAEFGWRALTYHCLAYNSSTFPYWQKHAAAHTRGRFKTFCWHCKYGRWQNKDGGHLVKHRPPYTANRFFLLACWFTIRFQRRGPSFRLCMGFMINSAVKIRTAFSFPVVVYTSISRSLKNN